MGFGLSLGLALASILLFILFLFTGISAYKKRWNMGYDMRNCFPYEINYRQRFTDNILPNAILTFVVATSLGLFIFFDIKNLSGATIVTLACGCLGAILVFFMFFTDIRFIRFHIALFSLLAIAAFGSPASIAVISYQKYQSSNNVYYIVIALIAVVVGLFAFALIMNPRLSFKLQMQKAVGIDGKETLMRPKYFVLAFSEWLFIFTYFFSEILLLLVYLPIK
ncbi:MAG: hypothetical protein K6F07_04210 [Bacilli bacterium]|nr:hypothetical protein [Bacilli bacterium]